MFVDKAEITVKGGDGGKGCCSFRREKFAPKGGPDGGNGGPGGSVIIRTATNEQSLVQFIYNRHFAAERGVNGSGNDKIGAAGKDLVLLVPAGTVIRDAFTTEELADLNTPGAEIVIAEGGNGGRGNACFASSVNRAPRRSEPGGKGEERRLMLELKTIADIGLVGYPNAGKSTLLGALSAAKPKVAPYPFTTLHPIIGIIEYSDFGRISMADLPGLIDGAHDNIGLGHSFLKHIERTKILAFVLDMAGVDGRTPWEDLEHLDNELELYMKGLSKRPAVILANKMDLPESQENLAMLQQSELLRNREIIPLSAATDGDFNELRNRLRELVDAHGGSYMKTFDYGK